jgi:hypothetical protein
MRQAAAWTASNLRHPPFEWSVSLPRKLVMRNAHVWQNVATSQPRDAAQHTYKTRGFI